MTQQISIGITGGIGSGKSSIVKHFESLGYPVYYADDRAKNMVHQPTVKKAITDALGPEAYLEDGSYHREWIRNLVFKDEEKRQVLNAIIHKAVKDDYAAWTTQQTHPVLFKEAAILFETGSYLENDYNILVTAPVEERIQRVMKRNNWNKEQIENIISSQWPDDKKAPLADLVVENINLEKSINNVVNWLRNLTS